LGTKGTIGQIKLFRKGRVMPNQKVNKKSVGQVSEESRLKEVITINPIGEMVLIPRGKFKMGLSEEEYETIVEEVSNIPGLDELVALGDDKKSDWVAAFLREVREREMPQQEIDLPAYYISREPVKRAAMSVFVRDGGYLNSKFWRPSDWEAMAKVTSHSKKIIQDNITSCNSILREPIMYPGQEESRESYRLSKAILQKDLAMIKKYGVKHLDLPEDHLQDMITPWTATYAFCEWLGRDTGKKNFFTLPFESEWEKAAKGGQNNIWPWGNSIKDTWLKLYPFSPWPEAPPEFYKSISFSNSQVWDWFMDESGYSKAQNPYGLRGLYSHRDTRRISEYRGGILSSEAPTYTFLPSVVDFPEWTASGYQNYPYTGTVQGLDSDVLRTVRGGTLWSLNTTNPYRYNPFIPQMIGNPGVNPGEVHVSKTATLPLQIMVNARCAGSRCPSWDSSVFRFRVVARDINKVEKMDVG
jgi:formylglycine-generating enzyme required for sulfatase activity